MINEIVESPIIFKIARKFSKFIKKFSREKFCQVNKHTEI